MSEVQIRGWFDEESKTLWEFKPKSVVPDAAPLVMKSEYDAAQSELSALREELATVQRGKDNADLALTTQTKNKDRYKQRAFAAEQRNAELEALIIEAHDWVDQNNFGGWDAYALRDRLAAAINPTESGASGSTCNQIREESGLPLNNPCIACNNGACIDR